MRPDENPTEANNAQVSDSEVVDDAIAPLASPQKVEIAIPDEHIDWGAEQNQGQPERWHSFETP